MAILHSERKKYKFPTSNLCSDYFCLAKMAPSRFFIEGSRSYIACRTIFHNYLSKGEDKRFFYHVHIDQKVEDVIRIITEAENKLQIPEPNRSEFWLCNRTKTVLYCVPNCWWAASPMRLNFFTVMIRSATKGNLPEVLDKPARRYIKESRKAVDKFLNGYTFYPKGQFSGWMSTFGIHADYMINSTEYIDRNVNKMMQHEGN